MSLVEPDDVDGDIYDEVSNLEHWRGVLSDMIANNDITQDEFDGEMLKCNYYLDIRTKTYILDDDDAEIDDGAARGDDGQRERRVRASDAMRASEREMAGDICARAMMGADARKRDRDATRDGPLKLARSGSGTWRSARRTTTDGGARMRETNVGCRRT